MKIWTFRWFLLLACVLSPAQGEHNEDEGESVIDLQDLLLNVQSTLKAFKRDQDQIQKSVEARLDKFENIVEGKLDSLREQVIAGLENFGKQDLKEIKESVATRLEKLDQKVDENLAHCQRENFSALLVSISKQVTAKLDKFDFELQKLRESIIEPTRHPTIQPTTEPTRQSTTEPTPSTKKYTPPRHCADVYQQQSKVSGVYKIQPLGSNPFDVYCDMTTDGGGWTVFQKRGNFPGVSDNNFFRGWQEYKDGFGDFKTEFWLGLSKVSLMTRPENGYQELRLDMADTKGERRYAKYQKFNVEDEKNQFRLNFGSYSGDAGDSLSFHNLQKFTTYDRDNDEFYKNCAEFYHGGWWYRSCVYGCLNGVNMKGPHQQASILTYGHGIYWHTWKGQYYSLAQTEMKFRPMEWKS